MRRHFDHIDLRVRDMNVARPFDNLLRPALGFTHDAAIAGWVQYEASGDKESPVFFGVTESVRHVANECRIAFWADSHADVRRLWLPSQSQPQNNLLRGRPIRSRVPTLCFLRTPAESSRDLLQGITSQGSLSSSRSRLLPGRPVESPTGTSSLCPGTPLGNCLVAKSHAGVSVRRWSIRHPERFTDH